MKTVLFVFAVTALILLVQTVHACDPDYRCDSWEACSNGIQTKACHDTACGMQDIVERRLCSETGEECQIKMTCSDWSPCSFFDKTTDLFNSQLSFTGVETRSCVDINGCADNFTEERKCSESYTVNFMKVNECGEPFIMALDPNSDRPVSAISLNEWKQNRLDISFVQGNFTYCADCYDGIKDSDEVGIDCGGSCKPCLKDTSTFNYLITAFWAFSAVLLLGFFSTWAGDKPSRLRIAFFRGYNALERKDIEGARIAAKKIKGIYSKMPYEEQRKFSKDLEHFNSRLGDYATSHKLPL